MLNNAYAITHYADRLANIATNIADLKEHLLSLNMHRKGLARVQTVINIFETYLEKGYNYIEKWLSGIWI